MTKKIFYILKPILPRAFQVFLRRRLVAIQRKKYKDIWPILEKSGKKPDGWPGWADNKKFAVVLTHDVEHQGGHDKCIQLSELENKLGFRSSFNFVPERYNVSPEVRDELVKRGFEVGMHGLNHDGKLFSTKKIFDERAKKINEYIKQWNVTGFRAPAMHHNLEWIQDLNIKYDLSTFDTDPFEPQSDGVETIFPFFVSKDGSDQGYWELPYTLVQDFTLLILMKENIDIWKKKVDWIVEKEGMVLLNVHPDYINLGNGKNKNEEFSKKYYVELLEYFKDKYNGIFWNPLPDELAVYLENHCPKNKLII
jgi:peptidoglycan/xylan/chitin deacetylase (PgdA/CDA1 family)